MNDTLTFVYDFWCRQVCSSAFLVSILSGCLTSFIFLFTLLFFFRPRFKLSPKIATHAMKMYGGESEVQWWVFKVVNRSFFRAFDLKAEIARRIPFTGPEGTTNYRSEIIKLRNNEYNHVAPFRFGDKSDYALWFLTKEDLSSLLSENEHSKIELRIICKHALTGLGGVFVMSYSKFDIKPGMFKSGNTFEIVN